MGKEYRAKVFKSGNSLALRLPKALGLKEGAEMVVREVEDGYIVEAAPQERRRIDVSGFWGKAPGIKLAPQQDFEHRPSAIAALREERQQK